MVNYYQSTWASSTATFGTWNAPITAGTWYNQNINIGTTNIAPISPFQERELDYRIGQDRYSYAEKEDLIKVDKGSPAKARYAVFYAVNKDPVIFCRTRREMIKEVKIFLKEKRLTQEALGYLL